jgi:hypothetical protein
MTNLPPLVSIHLMQPDGVDYIFIKDFSRIPIAGEVVEMIVHGEVLQLMVERVILKANDIENRSCPARLKCRELFPEERELLR